MLGDRYRLDEFVASGGMGQVFRATDKTLNRTVAVKVLLPGLTSDAEFGSRFRAEARIMASIGHKGVVGVYDYGETPEGTMFLVMAFVEGRPLGERITREGGLSATETMAIVAQAADALHAAHSNGGGSSCRCLIAISSGELPVNGGPPVRQWYATAPSA